MILDAVKDQLSTLIEDGYDLNWFFELSEAQLPLTQRQFILKNINEEVKNQFITSLPEDQRAQYAAAVRSLSESGCAMYSPHKNSNEGNVSSPRLNQAG